MVGHVRSHRSPDAYRIANLWIVSKARWCVKAERAAVAKVLRTKPQKPWISEEEAARMGRRRHLLDDNPTSG